MKKGLRLIVVALTLLSFTAAFADVGGTTSKGGGRSETIINFDGIMLGENTTMMFPWQIF